jgi:hypothetical protein
MEDARNCKVEATKRFWIQSIEMMYGNRSKNMQLLLR